MAPIVRLACLVPLLVVACGEQEQPAMQNAVKAKTESSGPAMPRSTAPADARLFFVEPANNATLKNPVTVVFGLEGMEVVPAGTDAPASGHHHLLVDVPLPTMGLPIPADANHVHFGKGDTETTLTLSPGEHTLQLLLGDYLHIPHQPPVMSETIRITVQ
ncbi:MAG: DUF4399 domain-containing protein [Woeseia sp.]|nr:DUF4399 domain-containing protein [Woeseia sp.]